MVKLSKSEEISMNSNIFENLIKTEINLIPESGAVTGSYSCTWWNQCPAAEALGLSGEGLSAWRDAMNAEALFDREDLFHPVPKEARSGLIFLLDDGWDVPIGTVGNDNDRHFFGSVDPNKDKFARFGGTPAERLKGISEAVKSLGYAGVGLWISPQEYAEEPYMAETSEEYWSTRAKWCHDAGVLYWKVDWGAHDYDDEYRRLISECVKKHAPDLLVEHAVVQKPLSHNHGDIEKFIADRSQRTKKQMEFSDVIRTYDVLEPFDKVCTLLRAHEALEYTGEHSGKGYVNGENLYAICSALGLTTGIMNYNKEALACINWQKIAPPFGVFESDYTYSDNFLCDYLFFDTEICGWAPCKGRTVIERAPAIMARGCPLPEVKKHMDEPPFVLASKNPRTGAYSVAALPRTVDPVRNAFFRASVTVKEVDPEKPVGVFGVFHSLTLELTAPISKDAKILAQDLNGDCAYDITEYATIEDKKITFKGDILRYVGKIARGHNDQSEPSAVIKIM